MKGDFTRFTHKPAKHYTGVLKQQGRVDLDADWNEYVSIQDYFSKIKIRDIIGTCGVPKTGGGFQIDVTTTGDGPDLKISPGRIYVHGILCQLETEATYLDQPDYPNPPALTTPTEGRTDLVYLDVWQRHITAIEDPDIREVALGGPDTATRVKTVWQVKVLEKVGQADCETEITGWPPSASRGRLSTSAVSTPAEKDRCLIAPGGGYRGLENRLYRVEIHDGSDPGPATFKWSRDNGSVVFAIEEFAAGEPNKVRVRRLGRDQVLALHVGDWVEVLGEETELKGVPGTMARIEEIDEAERIVTLSDDVSSHSNEKCRKVRRWDQESDKIPVTTTDPIDLEDGIRIQFSGDNFKTGDYWVFPARTATGDVESLSNAPPHGIKHYYCRLALVTWHVNEDTQEVSADVLNCPRCFPPLTELRACGCCCTVTVSPVADCAGEYTDIQAAIDALDTGGRVCILPGIYKLRETVVIRRNRVIITGCDWQTRIIGPDQGPAFRIENSTEVKLESLYVQAQSSDGTIQVTAGKRIDISDCRIVNESGWPSLSVGAETARIANNYLSGGGIWVRDGSSRVLIQANEIWNGAGPGIGLGSLAEGDDPTKYNTNELGFQQITGISAVEIVDNFIHHMDNSGISTLAASINTENGLGDIEDVTIVHNRIVGCARTEPDPVFEEEAVGGIVLRGVSQIRIHNNEIVENGAENQIPACGIFTYMCRELDVTDNKVINNGLTQQGQEIQCIDFTTMDPGTSLPNPTSITTTTGQEVSFGVVDLTNGAIISPIETKIVEMDENIGLDCQYRTEIDLPYPVTLVELTLAGFATVQADVDTEVTFAQSGLVGIWRLSGTDISKVTIASEQSETILLKFCFAAQEVSYQAAIVALFATSGVPPTSTWAVRIHDNIAVCPKGRSLLIIGAGSMSVADNALISHGLWEGPDPVSQLAQVNEYSTQGQCVFIINQDRTTSADYADFNVAEPTYGEVHYTRVLVADTRAYEPGDYVVFTVPGSTSQTPDGRVMFHGNQVTLQGEAPEQPADPAAYVVDGEASERLSSSAVVVISDDDVSLQDNQFLTEIDGGFGFASVRVQALTIRATGNRFTEPPLQTLWSYDSYAQMNITIGNQATHCIFSDGDNVIQEHNHIMRPESCNTLRAVRVRVIEGEVET